MSVTLLLMIGIMLVFLVISFRSTKKRQQEQTDFRDSLKVGQHVMTQSGLLGKIIEIDDQTVVIQSEDVKTRWVKAAVSPRPDAARVMNDSNKQKAVEGKKADKPAESKGEVVVEFEDVKDSKKTTKSAAKKTTAKKPAAKKATAKKPAAKKTATKKTTTKKTTKK